jgi:copper chaperone CopZ
MDARESAAEGSGTAVLSIFGMTCDGCVNTVKRILSRVPGVHRAEVELASGRAVVTGEARPEALLTAVQGAGYGAQLATSDAPKGAQDEHGGSGCC